MTLGPGSTLSIEPLRKDERKLMAHFDLFASGWRDSQALGGLIFYHKFLNDESICQCLVLEALEGADGGPLAAEKCTPGSGGSLVITRPKEGCCSIQ